MMRPRRKMPVDCSRSRQTSSWICHGARDVWRFLERDGRIHASKNWISHLPSVSPHSSLSYTRFVFVHLLFASETILSVVVLPRLEMLPNLGSSRLLTDGDQFVRCMTLEAKMNKCDWVDGRTSKHIAGRYTIRKILVWGRCGTRWQHII